MSKQNILLLLFLVVCRGADKAYDTSKSGQPLQFKLRVGQSSNLTIPYPFKHIWSISIPAASSPNTSIPSRPICTIQQPSISLQQIDFYMFSQWRSHTDVVVKFEELKKRQLALDMMVVDDWVYVCFASGSVKVLKVERDEKGQEALKLVASLGVEGVNKDKRLSDGYFVQAANTLMFVNQDYTFRITEKEAVRVQGYKNNPNFESVEYLEVHGLIAVAEGPDGISIYRLENDALTLVSTLGEQFFKGKIDISDVATYKNDVYILSRLNGIYKLSLNRDNLSNSIVSATPFNKSDCQNLVIHNESMYVTCPQIYEISLTINKTKEYPNELFHVKNLVVSDGMVIATGDNLIKLYIEGNLVGFYQSLRMDRLRISNKKMFIASESGITYVSWQVTNSAITCGLKSRGNQDIEGAMVTTVNLIAECDASYFLTQNIPFEPKYIGQNCVYHFPLKIDFWQGRQINFTPFKIVGIALLVLLVAILVGWFVIRRQFNLINAAIRKYSGLKPVDTQPKLPYSNMVEEKQQPGEVEMAERKQGKGQSQNQFVQKQSIDHHQIGD